MFKKFLATILAVVMVAALWIIPASAADVVLDLDYGEKEWKGYSEIPIEGLPLVNDYDGNFTFELYVKINDFVTPSVIAGSFAGSTAYAIWVNGGTLYFSAGDTNGNNHVTIGSDVTANWVGKWLHILGVKNGYVNKLFVCPGGSSEYTTASTQRTTDRIFTNATTFRINDSDLGFQGAGDFALGTVRMYNADVSANRLAMKAECEARLETARATEAPTEEPTPEPTEEPTPEPTEAPKREGDIILKPKPTKMYYEVGEELDLTGMVLATKIDGVMTPLAVEDCEITGFDSSAAGEVKVYLKYETEDTIFRNSFTLRILPKQPEGVTAIGLATKPAKLYYTAGEELDTTGLSILAKYADGTTAYVSEGLEVTGYDPAVTGNQRLTVSYEGHSTGFTITVRPAKSVIGIGLETKPGKLAYAYGEALDTTGLTILAKYSDGSMVHGISEGVAVTGYNAKVSGAQRVTISYAGYSTGFTVNVAEKPEGLVNPLEDSKFFTSTLTGDQGKVTASIMLPDAFTIEVKGSAAPGYLIYAARYQVEIGADGIVTAWEWNHSAPIYQLKSPEAYDAEDDIHVVLVGEGDTVTMYVNGEFSAKVEGIVVTGEFNFGNQVRFGWQSSAVEANFYNQAATAADLAAMYLAE